jgi:type IV pilus assembly protein PilC
MAVNSASTRAKDASFKSKETLFFWEGKDRSGKTVRGQMRASSASVVSSALRRQGIANPKVKKVKVGSGKRITETEVAMLTRQLATMMKAGLPLLQAFDVVGKGHENPSMTKLIMDIKGEVETGSALNQAFSKYPMYFDPLFCNLIAAGEQAGILENLLERLAIYKEKTLAIKKKIKSALTYPIAIVVVAFIITAVIMIFVIPSFKQVFSSFGSELPLPTQIVVSISEAFVAYWWLIFGGIFGGVYFFLQSYKRSANLRATLDRIFLRAPVFGNLMRKATIARWARTLSTMFAAGVPLVDALDSVGGAAGNIVYVEATRSIQLSVSSGNSLATSMLATNVFPNTVTQLVAIGEESGAIDGMLSKVADIYEAEVDDIVANMSALLEPVIMVVLGLLIGGIIVAMYLPIFKMGSTV